MTKTSSAEAIRRELERQGVSGRELARRLDKPPMYVSRRLTGDTDLRVSDLEAIAAALDVPPSFFIEKVAS